MGIEVDGKFCIMMLDKVRFEEFFVMKFWDVVEIGNCKCCFG